MGGQATEISEKNLVSRLKAAVFNGKSIRKTDRLNLRFRIFFSLWGINVATVNEALDAANMIAELSRQHS